MGIFCGNYVSFLGCFLFSSALTSLSAPNNWHFTSSSASPSHPFDVAQGRPSRHNTTSRPSTHLEHSMVS